MQLRPFPPPLLGTAQLPNSGLNFKGSNEALETSGAKAVPQCYQRSVNHCARPLGPLPRSYQRQLHVYGRVSGRFILIEIKLSQRAFS